MGGWSIIGLCTVGVMVTGLYRAFLSRRGYRVIRRATLNSVDVLAPSGAFSQSRTPLHDWPMNVLSHNLFRHPGAVATA